METLSSVRAQLEAADSTEAMLCAADGAFALIGQVAHSYASAASDMFATWMSVSAPASEGRFLLVFSSAAPALDPRPVAPEGPDEDEAAGMLAGLALTLRDRLRQTAPQAARPEDQQAFQHAADVAEEIRETLAADG